jgi:hypothetical protein
MRVILIIMVLFFFSCMTMPEKKKDIKKVHLTIFNIEIYMQE